MGRLLAFVFFWSVFFSTLSGHAQSVPIAPAEPTAPELERAKENFARGVELSSAAQWTHAALAFEEAYMRSGNPIALYNWASALREAGQLASAFFAASALLERHLASLDAQTRLRAEQLKAAVESRVVLEHLPTDAAVEVDGVALHGFPSEQAPARRSPETQSLVLSPGAHHIRVRSPDGRELRYDAALKPGETTFFQVAFAPTSTEPEAARLKTRDDREPRTRPWQKRALWIGGSVLLLTGVAIAATTLALREPSHDLSPTHQAMTVFRMP